MHRNTRLLEALRPGRARAWLAACAVGWVLFVSPARAHPDLDAGVGLAMEAEFEAALQAFESALVSGELTREELLTLLTERALVHHALGHEQALVDDLTYLASIEPSHDLGPRAPPALQSRWRSIVESTPVFGMKVDADEVPGGAQVHVQTRGAVDDTEPLVRIWTRTAHSDWQSVDASETEIPSPTGGEVLYYVQVLGMGDVPVLQAGSAETPRRVQALALAPSSAEEAPVQQPWVKRHKWWLVGGAVAVVAIAAIAGGVAAGGGGGGSNTSVMPPMVDF